MHFSVSTTWSASSSCLDYIKSLDFWTSSGLLDNAWWWDVICEVRWNWIKHKLSGVPCHEWCLLSYARCPEENFSKLPVTAHMSCFSLDNASHADAILCYDTCVPHIAIVVNDFDVILVDLRCWHVHVSQRPAKACCVSHFPFSCEVQIVHEEEIQKNVSE